MEFRQRLVRALRHAAFIVSGALIFAAPNSCRTRAPEQTAAGPMRSGPAALIMVVRDVAGNPVQSCSVAIGQHGIGGMTDARGLTSIANVPPGSWVVSWRLTGYFGDSLRVQFEPGREETLEVILREPEPERENPYENRRP